jgi:hypothetical protein
MARKHIQHCGDPVAPPPKKKEFIAALSYAQARKIAPWAVSMAWDPIRRGFMAWEDYFEARRDNEARRAQAEGHDPYKPGQNLPAPAKLPVGDIGRIGRIGAIGHIAFEI